MIKKFFLFSTFISIAALVLVIFATVTLISSGIPHNFLKRVAANELQKVFAYPIEFGDIRGNLLTNIIIDDIVIGKDPEKGVSDTLLVAKKANIDYNILNFVLGNKVFFSKKIQVTIDKPVVNIEHYRDDTFNILKMIAMGDDSSGGGEFPYKLVVNVNDAKVRYYDERGFGSEPLNKAVERRGRNLSAKVIFDKNRIQFRADGSVKDILDHRPFSIQGVVNLQNNKFKIKLHAERISFYKWGNYVFSMPGFLFMGGAGDVDIVLTQRDTPPKKYDLPFNAIVDVYPHDASFRVPWIKPLVQDSKGHVRITNTYIQFNELKADVGGSDLIMNGILDDFSKLKIDLAVTSPRFDNTKAHEYFPFLETWGLTGVGQTAFTLYGDHGKNPVLKGVYRLMDGSVYSHPLSNLMGSYTLKDNVLDMDIEKADLYGGNLVLTANVLLEGGDIRVAGKTTSTNLNELFRGSNYFDGHVNTDFQLEGVPADLGIDVRINPIDAFVLWQPIYSGRVVGKKLHDRLEFTSGYLTTYLSIHISRNKSIRA
jgi:hypothetical protein